MKLFFILEKTMNVGESQMEKESKKGKVFAYVVMGIYLLFLCWLILFKIWESYVKKIETYTGED